MDALAIVGAPPFNGAQCGHLAGQSARLPGRLVLWPGAGRICGMHEVEWLALPREGEVR